MNDLKEQFEKMRLEFEAYKKQFPATQISETPAVRVIDDDSDEENEPAPKPEPKQSKVKSVLSIIDGSDDEDEEEESTTINVKSHKIIKAINALDIDFIE